jgi:hypothetical protein
MRSILLSCAVMLVGCAGGSSYVHTDTTLGRVVVYRNGVAYFERYATVPGDQLRLAVPADKVDDFLKSLTVVDAMTGQPAPIAYPTSAPAGPTGLLDMDIHLSGAAPHRLKLSYVTEAPSWKPSYRVTLGKDGKVAVQAWAIVDNTSGEDWNQVKLGVGASSAMSFRFDLRSVRLVQRETLRSDDLFALAPPTGESTYANEPNGVVNGAPKVELSDAFLAQNDAQPSSPVTTVAPPPAAPPARGRAFSKKPGPTHQGANFDSSVPRAPGEAPQGGVGWSGNGEGQQFASLANALRASRGQVIVEGYASGSDGDKSAASLERANRAREQLLRAGVDPNRVVAVGKGEQAGHAGGVRILPSSSPSPADEKDRREASLQAKAASEQPADPIGTSHFESPSAMTVPRGSSAMVSILNANTDGEVVYLYDPETSRGNAVYPFRAVRIKNPTDSALESGPVTVFGDGKFIGEGMCEPIPARSAAFVPFALDRQIVVEHKDAEKDEIARILTVQRGVLSTEMQHTKKQTITLHNRLAEKAVVYVRHTIAQGYKLTHAPETAERMGAAHLFRVELAPNAKVDVTLEEATPVFRTTDLRTPDGLDMVKAFVSSAAEGPLKVAVSELLQIHRDMSNFEDRIKTTHEEMDEYRQRMDELHAQIVTLRAVKTAGPLMQSLEKKLSEMSDKLSKATVDVVSQEEKLMVARVHFQDKVADLTLEKSSETGARAEK